MDTHVKTPGLAPFSLRDAPTLIERVFPAQKVGIESQKERKAGAGQTLTALGSYWKGRKPLVLVRATVLACLLPATDDLEADIELFETLMRMDSDGLLLRAPKITPSHVGASHAVTKAEKVEHIVPTTGAELPEGAGEADTEDKEVTAENVPSRRGLAKWKPVDPNRFDDEAARVQAEGKARLAQAKAALGTKAEHNAAVAFIRAEIASDLARIRSARDAEDDRIREARSNMARRAFQAMPFSQQVGICERVERVEALGVPHDPLYARIWDGVNARLGTSAASIPELVEQIGIARFGHRPVVGDPFCGGGSIPFEAARVGCEVVASDLNPVAAMLTWGALNIIGADETERARIAGDKQRVAREVDKEITRLGIEHNSNGDRAKAYLYCLETVDPQTGWLVPMAPSWVISRNRQCIARLVPDYGQKRFDIVIEEGVTHATLTAAEAGTVRDGHLTYNLAPIEGGEVREWRISISRLRGDGEGPIQADGSRSNRLRHWELTDFEPRRPEWDADARPTVAGATLGAWVGGDTWQERLYCIQWMSGADIAAGRSRPSSFFRAPDEKDEATEYRVAALVRGKLAEWQINGLVSDMQIELGAETTRLVRERGWTQWHHLFGPRHILLLAILRQQVNSAPLAFCVASVLDHTSRLTRWHTGHGAKPGVAPSGDKIENVFYNQAFDTNSSFASRAYHDLKSYISDPYPDFPIYGQKSVETCSAGEKNKASDLWIYDPPYADAVHYHEITEFFIAWLRKNPLPPFNKWTWDSRRPLAIQGKGEKFRTDMVAAFTAMANHMPDNGLQVCMFTHKDAGVWADMAGIVWAAGLRVTAAWYVSTETTSELKQGGYVQGTVLLVLRKRVGDEHGYRSDIVPEVRARVSNQVETLTGLNQRAKKGNRDENLFSDADIQMAGYAAALEILTTYTHIDGVDMTREALRPRSALRRGQPVQVGIVEEMIALAVQTANERMLPDGLAEGLWERMGAAERFYLKMTAAEAAWPAGVVGGKLDDYQNFAKAYRAEGWEDLMADRQPNRARLKSATEFRSVYLNGHAISSGSLRPTLYALMCLKRDAEAEIAAEDSGKQVMHGLRDHFGDAEWLRERDNVRTLATWLGRTWERRNPAEATAARVLASLISSERL